MSPGRRRFWPTGYSVEIGDVNGQAALIMRDGDRTWSVLTITVAEGRIQMIWIVANPDTLVRI